MNHFVVNHIWIETHSKVKFFIEVKENHWNNQEDIEIVAEFYHKYSFDSVVLHVIAVNSKFAFNVLIDLFWLIIDLKMINCE